MECYDCGATGISHKYWCQTELLRSISEAAWNEGWIDRDNYCAEPYSPRMHNPYRNQTKEPT